MQMMEDKILMQWGMILRIGADLHNENSSGAEARKPSPRSDLETLVDETRALAFDIDAGTPMDLMDGRTRQVLREINGKIQSHIDFSMRVEIASLSHKI